MGYLSAFEDYLINDLSPNPEGSVRSSLVVLHSRMSSSLVLEDHVDFASKSLPSLLPVEIAREGVDAIRGGLNSVNYDDSFVSTGICPDLDRYNFQTLNQNSKHYRDGLLVMLNGLPLGHMKFRGDPSFLSWRNVVSQNGCAALFGGVYDLPRDFVSEYHPLSGSMLCPDHRTGWHRVDVSNLKISPKRFVSERLWWTMFGTSLRGLVRQERKRVEQMLYLR